MNRDPSKPRRATQGEWEQNAEAMLQAAFWSIVRDRREGQVWLAVGSLDRELRRVISLRYVEGKDKSQAAQAMGITRYALARLEEKALKKLRAAIVRGELAQELQAEAA